MYDTLRLINYIRSKRSMHEDPRDVLEGVEAGGPFPWDDDAYLVPVMENDAMLFHDWTDEEEEGVGGDDAEEIAGALVEGLDLNDPAIVELLASRGRSGDVITGNEGAGKVNETRVDDLYFESYGYFDIHREMLQDGVRTDCYRKALEENPSLITGARVLDVGCGTGVLSMFAARGGAAEVVGVDASPGITDIAQQLCARNGFDDTVRIVNSKVEDVASLPVGGNQVDVLVSEWMGAWLCMFIRSVCFHGNGGVCWCAGYALLFESMLDSVLHARDKFLKPGGAILPDIANLYVALGSRGSEGLTFWDNVYGLCMTPVADRIRSNVSTRIRVVESETLLSDPVKLHSMDLATMKRSDQDFSATFQLQPQSSGECSCIVLWFDTEFSDRFCSDAPQVLCTSPTKTPTHWAQTVLPLTSTVSMLQSGDGAATGLHGRVSMSRRQDSHRTLDISLEYTPVYADGHKGATTSQMYSIGVQDKSS